MGERDCHLQSETVVFLKMQSRKPEWLRIKPGVSAAYGAVNALLGQQRLHTVCQSARCPNQAECWSRGTATFMILGDVCTRACAFCAVKTGRPNPPDPDEPARVAAAVAQLKLRHVVITCVTRDDLPDGGAQIWAQTIRAVRESAPGCAVEVLTSDFQGKAEPLRTVCAAGPDIFAHNLETVERLQKQIRRHANYARSLEVLRRAAALGMAVKTGLMLGLGEREEEIAQALRDARDAGVRAVTLGQYLRPSADNAPVDRWVTPQEFDHWREFALTSGFEAVESGPLVRSSYRADDAAARLSSAQNS